VGSSSRGSRPPPSCPESATTSVSGANAGGGGGGGNGSGSVVVLSGNLDQAFGPVPSATAFLSQHTFETEDSTFNDEEIGFERRKKRAKRKKKKTRKKRGRRVSWRGETGKGSWTARFEALSAASLDPGGKDPLSVTRKRGRKRKASGEESQRGSGGKPPHWCRMAGSCIQPNQCRVRWYPSVLSCLILSGWVFSLLSSLDCSFVSVSIGFDPLNSFYSSDPFGVGLWSFESPVVGGQCLMYGAAQKVGGLTQGDNNYSKPMTNSDRSWSMSRGFAVLGAVCGFLASVLIWFKLCCKKCDPKKEWVLYGTILAFLCEGIKFGIFFNVRMCTASDMWLQAGSASKDIADEPGNSTDMGAVSNMTYSGGASNITSILRNGDVSEDAAGGFTDVQYAKAQECDLSRGSLASMGSILLYLVAMVLLLGNIARPKDPAHGSAYGGYDDVSLPTYLQSIGQSVGTKKTKGTDAPKATSSKDHTDISTIGMSMI